MKRAWLLCLALGLLSLSAQAEQDTINLFHKRSFGYSTGFLGLHSIVAPTFEMKTGPLSYRARLGYYSVGAGLELEYGHVGKARINQWLKSPVLHYTITYNTSYRWNNSHWSPFVDTKAAVKYEIGNMLLWGIKAYSTNLIAVGVKVGIGSLIGVRSSIDWDGFPFDRYYATAYPYGGISIYSYFYRARTD